MPWKADGAGASGQCEKCYKNRVNQRENNPGQQRSSDHTQSYQSMMMMNSCLLGKILDAKENSKSVTKRLFIGLNLEVQLGNSWNWRNMVVFNYSGWFNKLKVKEMLLALTVIWRKKVQKKSSVVNRLNAKVDPAWIIIQAHPWSGVPRLKTEWTPPLKINCLLKNLFRLEAIIGVIKTASKHFILY